MEIQPVLESLGLSEGEIKVYLSLLKLGSLPVGKIKEATGLHRTTIYDFVEKLLNKGLVSYVIKDNVKHFNAAEPEKLLDFLKDKEELVLSILPALTQLSTFNKEDITVEVLRDTEGVKTFLNDVLRVRQEVVAFGVDEQKFEERVPFAIEQYFKREAAAGIKERVLTSEHPTHLYQKSSIEYRFINQEYFSPTPTMIYGDRVVIIVWEPLSIIRIINANVAESYRRHFELLWATAKRTPS